MTQAPLGAAGQTRDTFAGLETWELALWYGLVALTTAIFLAGAARLILKYRRGRPHPTADRRPLLPRAARVARAVLTHAEIRRRDPLAGVAHLLVFYGFAVLFLGTAILAFQDDIARPLLGFDFWRGWFYLGYSLFLDLFGAALVAGLVLFAARRAVARPAKLDYARPVPPAPPLAREAAVYRAGDRMFLGSLLFLALTGFLLEAFRIAADDPDFETWAPLGWLAGQGLRDLGLEGASAESARIASWWVHGVTALFWVAAIPFTKALHMLAGPASATVRSERAASALPPPADPDELGYATIDALAPRHLLDLDACTRCGKCHAACPATATGYPLSPRDLVLDLREVAEGALGNRAALGIAPTFSAGAELTQAIRPETLWSCMQCTACVDVCPVGIEHVPVIVELRRALVERGELDGKLQRTLEAVATTGNSFGEPRRTRARWTRALDFPVKDARAEPVDVLWFVGDYASFDPRNQRATQALARLLHAAGVDFGILFEAEQTAGNDVRRVGEEGLWASLAGENLEALSACRFARVLTSDPHTFNTLRNEYPGLGRPVVHHSQLLAGLLQSGRLPPRQGLGYRVTYHDPCALGRMNGVYDEPRRVLAEAGCELVEMPRSRDASFCCGAGGGRIWMPEPPGVRRPSEERIEEAVALGGIDYFVVACPKDVTMYEDAIKTSGREGEIELRELSELVLEAAL